MRKLVFDIEIYKNFFCVIFLDINSGEVFSWEMVPGERLDRERLRRFVSKHLIIGFNSANFDLPVLFGAIAGLSVETLKQIADDIIVGGMKPWDVERQYGIKIPRDLNHIDLIEVAPGKASLKIYNGRLHGKRMQDLPIEPDAALTPREMDVTYDYCLNDLQATKLLYTSLLPQIELRRTMSKEYGIDLRSKSDAQVAEAVIKGEVGEILGETPKRPEIAPGTSYDYHIPDYIRYEGAELNAILDVIEDTKFRVAPSGKILMPKALSEAKIRIANGVYRMGIGGLHSSEQCAAHVTDDDYILIDRDVASYYPRIIINLGLFPRHMGRAFLKVYNRIVERRLGAKSNAGAVKKEIKALEETLKQTKGNANHTGPSLMEERLAELKAELKRFETEADSLKITINGSFGKFGSKWSALYSPQLLIQTTITGQLSLLMFIERLELAGITVVSANTDGIVIKCPRRLKDRLDQIVKEWERDTGFETDEALYSAIYSRDVNNYIAVKTDGTHKGKGAYAKTGMMKNPANAICVDAVVEYITKGTPISQTIRQCEDLTKFVTVRTVQGGATKDGEYLGKAIRWIYSTETDTAIHYRKANKTGTHNKVPKSDGARPIMELPDEFPTDIDYGWYIREARSILQDIGLESDLIGNGPGRKRKVVEEETSDEIEWDVA